MGDKKGVILERFQGLVDDSGRTRQAIANDLGCDTSTVTKQYNGDMKISVDYLVKYSKYFNVSADYLLGLSEAFTPDNETRFVCDFLGIKEDSIAKLRNMSFLSNPDFEVSREYKQFYARYPKIIDACLNTIDLLCSSLSLYCQHRSQLKAKKSECKEAQERINEYAKSAKGLKSAVECMNDNEYLALIRQIQTAEHDKEMFEKICKVDILDTQETLKAFYNLFYMYYTNALSKEDFNKEIRKRVDEYGND